MIRNPFPLHLFNELPRICYRCILPYLCFLLLIQFPQVRNTRLAKVFKSSEKAVSCFGFGGASS